MTIELGGNIQLTGFKVLDSGSLVIIKKIVGNYMRKFSDTTKVDSLQITIKPIHTNSEQVSPTDKFELHARLNCDGKLFTSEVTEHNIFVTLDRSLAKIESSLS